ncbi:ATP-binding protein [Phocaeicola salanitronis]|uniref:ATP-binding protein n=1 Tax=Phocaeicola salanitronis TaxID=376805 RepID=UPI0025A46301|nr:ATP-binding protein [Phocaeicola salanitronis]MDM8305353.1 ATP-binding protein [Phocaeicola salanitronis]
MTQSVLKKYPVGIQTFSELITKGYLYIDKTEYVYRMTHSNSKYMFLSRPRRFGKSLLTSTLRTYFEGPKELFEGLAIEKLETEWTQYPVLHFDMSLGKHLDKDALNRYLHNMLENNEIRLGITTREAQDTNIRLTNLIMDAYAKYGKQVVVLIDEYDAPLLDVVHEERDLPTLRNVMRNFYSPLKACDPYLRYVFLTGITKFSQLSIFSELNNIQNISMVKEYAALCGITEEEMRTQMDADLDAFAEKTGMDKEQLVEKLKSYYDGYHFTWPSPDIYNPYSLMNAFGEGELNAYWFQSGTPTYLIEMLRKYHTLPSEIGKEEVSLDDFDVPLELATNYMPLLYQAGYLTIKNRSVEFDSYFLDLPNQEVRLGLMKGLVSSYVVRDTRQSNKVLREMARCLSRNDMDGALRLLQTFLSTVPYTDNTDYEGHYQQVLYIIFSLLGYYVDVEVHTPRGRVDVVMRTAHTLYIIEVKLDKSAGEAMGQIDLKHYPERFALCGLPIVKVGINFDSERHTIENWTIHADAE